MAYVQKQNRFNLPKTGRGLGSGLLMKGGSPLAEVQFPIGPKTKLRSYEGLLNKQTGEYAAAGSEEANKMYAEAKRTGDYSILEGLTNTNKLGLQPDINKFNQPNFSVSPQVRNAISGLRENYGQDVETGVFNPGTDRQNEKAGQFSNDLAEMIMGYNVMNTPDDDKMDRGYLESGEPIAPGRNVNIPFDQGIATTRNGEDIFTTARAGVGKDEAPGAGLRIGVAGTRRGKDGNKGLVSRTSASPYSNEATRLIEQNINFNNRLNRTGAFTLSDFRNELEENPTAFYDTPSSGRIGIYERGTRNPGNRASLPNIRDNYMNYDITGKQQRVGPKTYGSITPGNWYNNDDYFNTGTNQKAEYNFMRFLEQQNRNKDPRRRDLDRSFDYKKYKSYEANRDIQGDDEKKRIR